MRMVDLIEKKRDGGVLTDDEIRFIIKGFTDGSIPDYQMSAFAMTVFYKGMTDHETAVLTDAMMRSGDTVDLSRFGDKSVDKHSTGGVGDKTTLIVAPIVSSLGGKMAKMSGRGLGHTGGTVDKLESIPGYQTTLSAEAFMQQVEDVGVAVIGQSGNLTPADKKLYALRDVTATIDSLPLITSSIMSKKLAAGAHSIVLDVKIGSGAFMKTLEDGQKLAESMVRIGKACGRNVVAVMSNMDIPLGFYIGNALEVREAVEVLRGHGCPDLTGVCITLAANMLHLCNGWPIEEATKQAEEAISSGRAFEQMKRWIAAQGGDARVLDDVSLLPQAAVQVDGIRGGQIAVQPLFADHIAGGADQAGLEARLFQNGLHQVAGGGLALGAAHAHHTDLFFRVAVEGRGDIGHGGTDVFHLHLRHIRIQNALHHKGDAAVFLRLAHKRMSVKARAADAEEQTAGGLLPAVGDQGVYADFHIPLRFQNSGYVHQQILQ